MASSHCSQEEVERRRQKEEETGSKGQEEGGQRGVRGTGGSAAEENGKRQGDTRKEGAAAPPHLLLLPTTHLLCAAPQETMQREREQEREARERQEREEHLVAFREEHKREPADEAEFEEFVKNRKRPRGHYVFMRGRFSVAEQREWLHRQAQKKLLLSSASLPSLHAPKESSFVGISTLLAFETDVVFLLPAAAAPCPLAALCHSAMLPNSELGIGVCRLLAYYCHCTHYSLITAHH